MTKGYCNKQLLILCTGGTISRCYHDHNGELAYDTNLIPAILGSIRHTHALTVRELMNVDSKHMTEAHRRSVADAVADGMSTTCDGIVITHGTDTMAETARYVLANVSSPRVPVVFTGAMRPYSIDGSDARQNMIEAITVACLAAPGVYIAMHARVLTAANARKDFATLTFVPSE